MSAPRSSADSRSQADRRVGRTAIVVVNYGSHALLGRNLILPADPRWQVLVVDNETTAEERAAVTTLTVERGWEFVAVEGNPGFGAAVNLAAGRAAKLGCDSLLLVNPDAVITEDAVLALVARVHADPRQIVSPRIVDAAGARWFDGSWLDLRTGRLIARPPSSAVGNKARWVPWLTGACLALDLEFFCQLGGFDDGYFLYWEDVDLTYRAQQAGGHLAVVTDVTVVHDEGGTHAGNTSPRAKSALYYRYNARNRLVFAARHLSGRALLGWVTATPRASWQILLRGGRRQLLHSPRPLWAAVRGSTEGLWAVLRAVLGGTARRRRQ